MTRSIALLLAACAHLAAARVYAPPRPQRADARRVAVDKQGFVWISGDDRTYRFDGVRYLDATRLGLPASSSQYVAVPDDGTVWIQSERMLWRLAGGRFRFQDARAIVSPIEAAGSLLWVNQQPMGVFHWDRSGELRWNEGPVVAAGLRLHGEPDGRVWFGGRFEQGKPGTVGWARFGDGRFEQGEETILFETLPSHEVAPAGANGLLTGHKTLTNRYERAAPGAGFRHLSQHIVTAQLGGRLLAGHSGEIWYEACGQWLSSTGRGIHLAGAQELARDAGGGLWAALGDKGLAYAGRDVQTYSLPGYPDRPVVAMSRQGGRLLVARQDMTAVIAPVENNRFCNGAPNLEPVMRAWGKTGAEAPFTGVIADPDGKSVWVLGKNFGVSHMTSDGRFLDNVPFSGDLMELSNLRQAAFTADGRLWLASKSNLLEVRRGPPLSYAKRFPRPRYVGAFARSLDGRAVAVAEGAMLHYAGQGEWREDPLPSCLLSQKPRTVAIAGDDDFWVAYRDKVGFTRARRKSASSPAWTCEHFDASNGFPGDTQFLAGDRQGRLWRGSGAGVFVNRPGLGWAKVLETGGEMHQLFYEDADGSIFVGVKDRLLRLPPQFADADPGRAPVVSYLEAGGEVRVDLREPAPVRLGEGAMLYLAALPERELAAPAAIEYRFGPGGGTSWQTVHDHALSLDQAPGSATKVEFRYAGQPGVTVVPLLIEVPWWRSTVFAAVVLALLAGLGYACVGPVRRWLYWRRKRQFVAASPHNQIVHRPAQEMGLASGTLLHERYRIGRLLADGGFSQVYVARDEKTGDEVVVKRLRTGDAHPSRIGRRFAQEVAAVSMVRHEGVVPILDAWMEANGIPHMVLPLIKGPTLRERLRLAPFQPPAALELLRKLADVMAAAHARGVVHSDLKPENILLAATGPKVIDFGASALQIAAGLNDYSRPAGSVQYMAPEQLLGRYSRATDVYAFALIALEVLTGRKYADIELPMNEDWEPEFRRVAEGELGLSAGQAGVFVEALRFDPDRRAQDLAEWMARLEQVSAAE